MSRPRAFDPDAALAAARDAFWQRGYEATSLADLEAATGLSRSSIYQAFGSKRALFDAAVDHYRARLMDPMLQRLEQPDARPDDVRAYLAGLAATFRADGPLAARGCLVVNTMAELADRDDAARATAVAYQGRVTSALANGLADGAVAGTPERGGADRRAAVLYAAVVGALVMSHVDREAAATLCEQLAAELPG